MQELFLTANLVIPRKIRVSSEPDKDKSSQQPSVLHGSFTQIMVNPMQLQDHEFTDLWKPEGTDRRNDNVRTEHIVDLTMKTSSQVTDGTNRN